jgi:ribosomal-protein-alanine N-acetyltransferase
MIIGYAHLKPIGDGYDLINICVKPEHRGKGIAKKMLTNLLAFAKNKPIMLEVRKSNVPAIQLYSSMGFTTISERPNYYKNEDAWVMKYNANN